MHELIFYSIIILIFIRLVGFIVSIDFYFDSKSKTYIYFILGWGLWTITGIFPLLTVISDNQIQKEFFLLTNAIFGSLAITFLMTGIASYYINISKLKILLLSTFLTVFPLILYLTLGRDFVLIQTMLFQFFVIILGFLLPIFRFKNFKERIGRSIRWYYLTFISILIYIPLIILNIINNADVGLFQSESIHLIISIYTSIIITTILIIAYMIHLEYNAQCKQKSDLKDKYSHELGNIMQAIFTSYDIMKTKREPKKEVVELETILEKKLNEASKLIREIRKI